VRLVGELAARVQVCNLLVAARLDREVQGIDRPQDIPVGKLSYSELNLALAQHGVALQGPRALLVKGDDGTAQDGRWQDEFLYARTYTVAGGASELMRDLIAERSLGMPRGRGR
jgi:hypothetical protein